MSNLFKKVTSATMALLIVLSIINPFSGVMAAYSTLDAANKLASLWVIVDWSSNPANYRLGDSITRWEMAKVTMNLAGWDVQDTCANKYKDLSSAQWACKYAEAWLARGFFAANEYFRPNDSITKAESLKMIMQARGIDKSSNTDWRAAYVEAALDVWVLDASFTDYDKVAQRGWIFQLAANAIDVWSSDDAWSILDDLLWELTGTGTSNTWTNTWTTVVVWGKVLGVALSPTTPAPATVPGGINWLPVAKYTITAWSEDVSITSMVVTRTGLSNKDTLSWIAAFTEDGRVSKARDDSQNNDTEATLTISPALVIKAWETKTLTLVVDINNSTTTKWHEFNLTIKEITASVPVEYKGDLVSSKFTVGAVNAAKLTIRNNGSVSNPTLGQTQADMFKFEITWDSNQDIIVKSLTFRSDNSSASEDLVNFKLYRGTTEVASTANMNGRYVTFNLGTGYTLGNNKIEKFIVKADVVAGAWDQIKWYVDKNLDIYAIDTKYGYGTAVDITNADNLGQFTVLAWQLTLSSINPASDKIRTGKKDSVLAELKVTNVQGKSLELQKFAVNAVLNPGTAYVDLNNNFVKDGAEAVITLDTLFENFELYNKDTWASYELDLNWTVYRDLDLNIPLAQWVTNFQLRADVKNDLADFDTASVNLSMKTITASDADGVFYVVETGDEKQVTDIAPSSLTWKAIKGTESSATVTVSPLSNISKVRGASWVEAMKFQIEADQSSAISTDQIKVVLKSWAWLATNITISQATLYQGSIADANVLDRVSGSSIASDGSVTFDGFVSNIAAWALQTYYVTLDFVDWIDSSLVANNPYVVTIDPNDVSVDDEDGYTVFMPDRPALSSPRLITITDFGTITVTQDGNNTDNINPKTVLWGTSKKVFSVDVVGMNENIDVWLVEFILDKNIKSAVDHAALYLWDKLIATNTNSDIVDSWAQSTITFKNMSTLIIPQSSQELVLELYASSIWFEKVGKTTIGLGVDAVNLKEIEGADSGHAIADVAIAWVASDQLVDIVPAIVTPSVVESLSASSTQAKIKLTVDSGVNTIDTNNASPSVTVQTLTFSTVWATDWIQYTLYEDGVAGKTVVATSAGNKVVFTIAWSAVNPVVTGNKTFVVVPTLWANQTATLILPKDGIVYDVNMIAWATGIKTQLSTELNHGSRTVN